MFWYVSYILKKANIYIFLMVNCVFKEIMTAVIIVIFFYTARNDTAILIDKSNTPDSLKNF